MTIIVNFRCDICGLEGSDITTCHHYSSGKTLCNRCFISQKATEFSSGNNWSRMESFELREQLEILSTAKEHNEKKIAHLREEVEKLYAANVKLEDDLRAETKELVELKGAYARLEKTLSVRENRVVDLNQELEKLSKENCRCANKIVELKKELKAKSSTLLNTSTLDYRNLYTHLSRGDFGKAKDFIAGQPCVVCDVVRVLSTMYGNNNSIREMSGYSGVIVRFILDQLLG